MAMEVAAMEVEGFIFPPTLTPPGSSNTLFLGGAGFRGLEINGRFIKFTTIGVYLENDAIPFLATKWKGKSAKELSNSIEFFRDVVTGPFEKCARSVKILQLDGPEYSRKVTENSVEYLKATGTYGDAEAVAAKKFSEALTGMNFESGSSLLYTFHRSGSLTVCYSKDGSIPKEGKAVTENKNFSEAILESMIGEHGVTPGAKRALAERVSKLLA